MAHIPNFGASPLRVASDIGGVILESFRNADESSDDFSSTSSLVPGALEGLAALSTEYEIWLISYCGLTTETKTRAVLLSNGVAAIVPEERWCFVRDRKEKVTVMRANEVSLLVDDRGDIVSLCHANYQRAIIFRQETDGGRGWPGIPTAVAAALSSPVPDPRFAYDDFLMVQRQRGMEDRAAKRAAAGPTAANVAAPSSKKSVPEHVPESFVNRVCFLGTGSGLPTRMRGASATVMCFADNSQWLFDCGEGTQVQFGRSSKAGKALKEALPGALVAEGISMGSITRIFITHLHGDHVFGLPGLLLTLSAQRFAGGAENESDEEDDGAFRPFNEDTEYLEIVGPAGLANFLRVALVSSDAGHLRFRYRVSELVAADDPEPIYPPAFGTGPASVTLHVSEASPRALRPDADGATTIAPGVLAARIDHRVTCYGFSVTESERLGALDAIRASELGVRGKEFGLLKGGKDVTLADGRVVRSVDCVNPPTPGRVIIHLGDCLDNSALARAARGSSPCPLIARARAEGRTVALVVHEATFCDSRGTDAIRKGHCTARHAAAYAAEAGAETLCLTHLSQRYLPRSYGADAAAIIDEIEEEARAELRARGAHPCAVRCVEDFEAVSAATS